MIFAGGSPARTGALYLPEDRARQPAEPYDGVIATTDAGGRGVEVQPLGQKTGALRLVKDADEVARLRKAIDITAASLGEALAAIEPGLMEYEVEAVIEYGFRRRGAERVGFPSIVGAGDNATVLHYDRSRGRLEAGDLVVMDVGAEYGYYSADVTRTAPVSGRFTPRQRELYELVLATQQTAIDSARPGRTVADLNRIARTYMREHSGSLCGEVTCDTYWVHGLSHWLGMDVHDAGDYRTPLLPGMVLTIEPGIYIPSERIGIRIEDDVLVTAAEPEVLSAAAPRTAAEIERAMSP
jgi:Xaa-Pro aminopeptidase